MSSAAGIHRRPAILLSTVISYNKADNSPFTIYRISVANSHLFENKKEHIDRPGDRLCSSLKL